MKFIRELLLVLSLLVLSSLAGCSGGGGGGGSAPEPAPPAIEILPIELVDSIPSDNLNLVDSRRRGFSFVHASQAGAVFDLEMNCDGFQALSTTRVLEELSEADVNRLVDHRIYCPAGLTENFDYSLEVTETRANGTRLQGAIGFQADSEIATINLLAEEQIPRDELNALFGNYVSGGLVGQFELPTSIELLLLAFIIDLAGSEWDNLADPNSLYDVVSQRVEYGSSMPDGTFTRALTGLIAYPDIGDEGGFSPRDEIILLTHATGSTPSEMDHENAWFIIANLLAGQGYLVVAPDNFGRGGTSQRPETYLQGNRTGMNAVDLLVAVTESGNFTSFHEASLPVPVRIVGYSQGGHSAIASWLEILRSQSERFTTLEVHSGGAPLDLYRTFRGVMQQIDGSCDGDGYCDLVDRETTIPFATERILPGLLEYTDIGLIEADIILDDDLRPAFVTGFLANETQYDKLKMMLQLSSYTNIVNTSDVFDDALVSLNLYHSAFDRLVPFDNTLDFAGILEGNVQVTLHQDMCNSSGFKLMFEAVEKVGVVHTLCGLNVLDEVFDQLR